MKIKMEVVTVGVLITAFLTSPLLTWSVDHQARISADICKLETEFDNAIIARDNAFLSALLADEYQHTNYMGGITDKKAELNFFASPEFALKQASIDACSVRVYGHIAIATGVNNWTEASLRGRDLSGLYRFTTVYLFRRSHWQIVVAHASKITRVTLLYTTSGDASQLRKAGGDRAAIVALENDWLSHLSDGPSLDRILVEDFMHPVPQGLFLTKQEHTKWATEHRHPASWRAKFEKLEVRVYGAIAIAHGIVEASDGPDAKPRRTIFTDVFVYRDNHWKAVNAQENEIGK